MCYFLRLDHKANTDTVNSADTSTGGHLCEGRIRQLTLPLSVPRQQVTSHPLHVQPHCLRRLLRRQQKPVHAPACHPAVDLQLLASALPTPGHADQCKGKPLQVNLPSNKLLFKKGKFQLDFPHELLQNHLQNQSYLKQ